MKAFSFLLVLVSTCWAFYRIYAGITAYGVELPFYDEWVYFEPRVAAPGSEWSRIFRFHNEHLIVTTNLVFAFLIDWTHLSHRLGFLLNLALAAGVLVVLMVSWYRTAPKDRNWRAWFPITLPWLIFSPQQFENWTWVFQIQWYLTIFFVVLGLFLFANGARTARILAGGVAGVLATISTAGGVFIWPAAFFSLGLEWYSSKKRPPALPLVAAFGIASVILYSFAPAASRPKAAVSLLDYCITWFALIGAPICNYSASIAPVLGAFGVICSVAVSAYWLKARDQRAALWFSFLAYGILGTVVIAVSRAPFGGVQYVLDASRYTTVSTLFWVGLLGASALLLPIRKSVAIHTPFLMVLAACYYNSLGNSTALWAHRHAVLTNAQHALLTYSTGSLELAEPSSAIRNIGFIRPRTLDALRERDLSLFRARGPLQQPVLAVAKSPPGYVDAAQELSQSTLEFAGWAADPANLSLPAPSIIIRSGSRVIAEAPVDGPRPDVATVVGQRSTDKFGWHFVISRTEIQDLCSLRFFSASRDRVTIGEMGVNAERLKVCPVPSN